MNDAQKRALWATAFQDLATAISTRRVNPPTSVNIWTQYVTAGELLAIADGSYTKPLPINLDDTHAAVTVPVGELLDLPIVWISSYPFDRGGADLARSAFSAHNQDCVPDLAPDAE